MENLQKTMRDLSLDEYTQIYNIAYSLTMLEYKLGTIPIDPHYVVNRMEMRVERLLEAQRSKSFVENPAPPS